MQTVGFYGGSALAELGPAADVELFFDCIKGYAIPADRTRSWKLLTDDLYRRYVNHDQFDAAQELMTLVERVFEKITSSEVNWSGMSKPGAVTRLSPSKPNLAAVFNDYFEKFAYCRESAEIFFRTWDKEAPLRLVRADLPAFFADKKRSMADYDQISGAPLWSQ